MRKRIALIGVNLAIVLAVVGGTIAYASMSKTVTLSIDGQAQEVKTFADDVGGLLEQEDIEVGEHDVVAPGVDSEINEGTAVAVRYGRELTVTTDGVTKTYWVTATNVEDALGQLDLRIVDSAELSASRSTPIGREGLELTISTPKRITLVVGGERQKLTTTAATVGEVLAESDIELTKHDKLVAGVQRKTAGADSGSPGGVSRDAERVPLTKQLVTDVVGADETVVEGMRIEVTRVGLKVKTVKVSVPYKTIVRHNDDMFEGKVRVKREGVEGLKRVTYRIRTVDGDVAKRVVLKSKLLKKPRAQIEIHGTKERPSSDPDIGDESVWDALADCESGGDWSINTGNGYYGGLQFSYDTWHAYGGGEYADYPHEASREEQIDIAEKVRDATGGYGSWPGCASELGLPM